MLTYCTQFQYGLIIVCKCLQRISAENFNTVCTGNSNKQGVATLDLLPHLLDARPIENVWASMRVSLQSEAASTSQSAKTGSLCFTQ